MGETLVGKIDQLLTVCKDITNPSDYLKEEYSHDIPKSFLGRYHTVRALPAPTDHLISEDGQSIIATISWNCRHPRSFPAPLFDSSKPSHAARQCTRRSAGLPSRKVSENDSSWLWVKPRPGCLIVNMDDAMVQWTGGLLRSNVYRISYVFGLQRFVERYSLALLARPKRNAIVRRIGGGRKNAHSENGEHGSLAAGE
ncbi:hypothetical protein F4779DRAFT_622386 [Xylariaceae sp. FL0662B]|nr:hypothetical protein F4779DRAFT_622386 [Xylariaceae sp. FL0662B]